MKLKKFKSQNEIIVFYLFVVFVVLLILYHHFLYYACYTIDYLLNRYHYVFKEEGKHEDNKFTFSDSIFRSYINWSRESRLNAMPYVKSEPLPELTVDNLTFENAYRISDRFTKPFVVRGLIQDFDCVQLWNLDYFEQEYGDVKVPVFYDDSGSIGSINNEKIKKCNSDNNLCDMKTICENIRNGEPLYINNISTLFIESEQARSELNLDKMSDIVNQCFLKNSTDKNLFISQLFLGGKNTGTSLHCASNINFFFNINGVKRWGFIDSKYTSLIKCQTSKNGLYCSSSDDFFSEDPNNPFLKIPRHEITLYSGDFLYNPAWYWHAVKNESDYTIAVANRYMKYNGELPSFKNNIFFSFLQSFSLGYYLSFFKQYKDNDDYIHQTSKIVDREIINGITKQETISYP